MKLWNVGLEKEVRIPSEPILESVGKEMNRKKGQSYSGKDGPFPSYCIAEHILDYVPFEPSIKDVIGYNHLAGTRRPGVKTLHECEQVGSDFLRYKETTLIDITRLYVLNVDQGL
jgi:hypothetical protein